MRHHNVCSEMETRSVHRAGQNTNSTMADEALARAGLHFDELNKIRVLEPEIAQQTGELKEECKEFLDSMDAACCP